MKYIFLIFLVFNIGQQTTNAEQNPLAQIDSLQKQIENASDTTLAVILNQISWNYRNINIDSSIYYAQNALEIAKSEKYASGVSHSLNYLGIAYRNQGNYSKALTYFFDALKSSEDSNDKIEVAYSLINIGNIYIYQTNFEGAITYFDKALVNAINTHNQDIIAYCHLNLGRSYSGLGNYTEAEKHYLEAQSIRKSMEDIDGTVIVNVDLAGLYIKQNDLGKALTLLQNNLQDVIDRSHNSTLAYSYLKIAQIHDLKNQLKTSKVYIEKCLDIVTRFGLKNIENQALELMSKNQEKSGNNLAALTYYKQFKQLHDSIFNEENTRKIESLHSQYLGEKKAIETKNLRQQKILNDKLIKRQSSLILVSVIASILFFLLAVIGFWFSNERKKLIAQIEKQKDQAFEHNNSLIDINNEKNNLIRILSHDLRAPINNIKGLTQVHQLDHKDEFSESENQTLNLIKSESDRLLSMISKILNVEALEMDIETKPMDRVDVTEIMNEVINSFSNASQSKKIDLISKFENRSIYIHGDSVHLHQILENLISNALKFSHSESQILLDIECTKNVVQISVSDQGPGLTDDDKNKIFKKFQTLSAKPTGNEESTGLGLSIVKKYVGQMNGLVWHESKIGEGTTFIVEFKEA